MYRTDKQFMKNPATAAQRVYIGSLAKTVVASDLEEKFGAYGNILGLAMQSGFAFIQFENEQEAQAAIKGEHGSQLYGRKIVVKQAMDKSKGPGNSPQQKFNQNRNFPQNQQQGGPGGKIMGRGSLLGDGPNVPPPQQRQDDIDDNMQMDDQGDQPDQPGGQEEPEKPDGPPGPQSRFDGPPNRRDSSGGRHDGPPGRHDGPPGRHDGPPGRHDGPPGRHDGPPGRHDGPPGRHDGPPGRHDGPAGRHDGPPGRHDGPPGRHDGPPGRHDGPQGRFDGPPGRHDGPPNRREDDQQLRFEEPPRFDDPQSRFDEAPSRFDDHPSRFDDPPMRDGPRFDRGGGRKRGRGGRDNRGGRFEPPPLMDKFRDQPPFFGREEPFAAPAYNPPPPVAERPERNDCEIIVVSKALTEYAEYIEQRLKGLGLVVDLLFPNEDVPIGRVLANISSRGCLYAILVMPQNEEHRSLTLNILHGIPQEHRNMPIEDALMLITRNFEAYMRGEPAGPENTSGLAMSLADRHPMPMQMLLNLLAENRQMTSGQYEKLLKYLQERRELQVQYELAEGIETTSEGSTTKQAELQNRILNILNKSESSATTPTPPVPTPATGNTVQPSPLLKDPTVQKALDSLMLGDMFKSMGTA